MSVGALATIEDPIADRTQAVRGFTSAGKFHISCVGGFISHEGKIASSEERLHVSYVGDFISHEGKIS